MVWGGSHSGGLLDKKPRCWQARHWCGWPRWWGGGELNHIMYISICWATKNELKTPRLSTNDDRLICMMQIINTLVILIGMCACKHSYFQKEISLVWWFWTKLIAESLYSIFSIFLFFLLCYSFPPFPSPPQKNIFFTKYFRMIKT